MASPDGTPSRDDGTSAVSGDVVNEALRAENALLRAENAALLQRLVDLERTEQQQQWQATIQRRAEEAAARQQSAGTVRQENRRSEGPSGHDASPESKS